MREVSIVYYAWFVGPINRCSRYYETDIALQSHWKSKIHKRRLKQLREPAYTIEESERAAGLGRETRRPGASAVPAAPLEMVVEPTVV